MEASPPIRFEPTVGIPLHDKARVCMVCGSPLAEAAAGLEERKVVTVLFADNPGGSRLP